MKKISLTLAIFLGLSFNVFANDNTETVVKEQVQVIEEDENIEDLKEFFKSKFVEGCTNGNSEDKTQLAICECTWDKFETKFNSEELSEIDKLSVDSPQVEEIKTFALEAFTMCAEGK